MANPNSTQIPAVPIRTPLFAGAGDLARPWEYFFSQLGSQNADTGSISATNPGPIHEIPAGLIDGLNKQFYLSYAPLAGWLVLHMANALQDPIADYTLSGNTITYTQAPQPGDTHHAWYLTANGAKGAINPLINVTPLVINQTAGLSAGKVIWLGAGSPPANWQTPGFNDSSWGAPVASIHHPPTGITDTNTGRVGEPYHNLYRVHFTVPPGSAYTRASWTASADDAVVASYVNGISAANGSCASMNIAPGDNLIAVETLDSLAGFTALYFILTLT
jgi:hypothetical protein